MISTRNTWPVAITAFFGLFFCGLVAFIAFAASHSDDLVRPDYYEEELHYQKQLDRLVRTQEAGEPLSIQYDSYRQCVRLHLLGAGDTPSSGTIHLYRPSNARMDRRLPLALDRAGFQCVEAGELLSGLWNVRVQWVAGGQEYYLSRAIVIPKRS